MLRLQTGDKPAASDPSWGLPLTGYSGEADTADTEVVAQHWWHVSLQYLQPYRPTFQRVTLQENLPDSHVVVEQTGEFLTDLEACDSLSLDAAWSVQVFHLSESQRPLGTLQPKQGILKSGGSEAVSIWPVPQARRRGRRAHPKAKAQSRADQEGDGSALAVDPGSVRASSGPAVQEEEEEEEADEVPDEVEAADSEESSADTELQHVCELALQDLDYQAIPEATSVQEHLIEGEVCLEEVGPVQEEPLLEGEEVPQTLGDAPVAAEAAGAAPAQEQVLEGPVAMPPPPIPEQLEADAVSVASSRGKAEISLEIEGGKLTFYRQGFFTATCRNVAHTKCVMTRTSQPGRRAAQGRPLGFLVAWLALSEETVDKTDHWNRSRWPDHATRTAARHRLAELPGGQELLECERQQEPGETSEPDNLP